MKKKYLIYFFTFLSVLLLVFLSNMVYAAEKTNSTTLTTSSSIEETDSGETTDTTDFSKMNKLRAVSTKKAFGNLPNLKQFSLDSQNTGIVAYNFGKSPDDIKALNGDINAAKSMILYESGATATGLLGDVSDNIVVGDLGDLLSTTSTDLAEHKVTLTVPSEYSGIGKDLTTTVVIYTGKVAKVSTWSQLDAALMSNDTTIIDVQNNMTNTSTVRADRSLNDRRKDYVLLGNGYSLDFIGYSYKWGTNTSIVHKPIVDNVDLYGGHYFGPVTMWDRNAYGSSITYRNVNYTGSQITASFQAVIKFEGKNNIRSKDSSYISYDGKNRSMADTRQSGLESHTLSFSDNTDTLIETEQGDAVILGSWYSNWDTVSTIQPSLTVGKNANVVLRTLGNDGETNSWQTSGGSIPSVISIQRNGRIDIGEGAKLTAETADGTTRVPVRLGYNNSVPSSWITSINLADKSQFNVNIGGPIANNSSRAAFMLQDNSQINVGENASMIVNAKNMTTGSPVISMGTSSLINVEKSGALSINKTGGRGRILNLSSQSNFKVSDEGSATFVSDGETTSTDQMIYGGNGSTFLIDERGIFTSRINNGTGTRNMLQFASGANFSFANVRRVDLDARGNTNASLISMDSGKFNASIQEVSAWTKADASKSDPTYNWRPMYGMVIPYRNTTTGSITANSLTNSVSNDFKSKYKTENFSRVVFDYIPDVQVSFDAISDNKNLTSGQKFTGTVNNNAYVAFYKVVDENDSSKDSYITTPSYNSPDENDKIHKFHVKADSSGKYEFTLPDSVTLQAGEKVKAYAYLDGKDDDTINTVQDKTAPTADSIQYYASLNSATPSPQVLVKNVADTNPNNKNYTYSFNQETPQSTIDGYMTQLGDHTVKVDVADEAGNTTTITSTLTITKSSTQLTGDNLSITYKELRNMSEDQLKQYILTHANLDSFKVENGVKTDLTKFITVSDLGGLLDLSTIKTTPYTVNLKVSAQDAGMSSDITASIEVSITEIDSVLTIHFVNEANKVLDTYTTTINAKVGDTVDLTKDSGVVKQIDTLESDGYFLVSRPDKESNFNVTDTAMTINYGVKGTVGFESVPTELDFGTVKYTALINRVEKPEYDKNLVVRDTRADAKNGWSISAAVTTPLQTTDGKQLTDVLRYVSNGKELVLSDASQLIYSDTSGKAGSFDISNSWGDTKQSDGIKLQLSDSGDIYTGSYIGEITWKIMEGQP
ncbi:pectate lyase-like adhesive domain-containing protein [Vagococcus luciliae]|uniref:WxL domain-containing protein n=1 Tax=Vagococcus luciliae TaxID=2920380 RepID=A0ABY5P0V9_9ENTE|nr:pectate lyase-like adhesive domain-containing protein [Vagococcus luciliae]UUV99462.1 hypothetical protein G314FT_16230 [Vagococcus luciliae]